MSRTTSNSGGSGERLDHALFLLDGFHRLWEKQDMCDVVIKVSGKKFNCHKLILAVNCCYFERLFAAERKNPQTDGELVLHGVSSAAFETALQYIYTGNIKITFDTVEVVLQAAAKLRIPDLLHRCGEYLLSFNKHNCLAVHDVAQKYDLANVLDLVTKFIYDNFIEISQTSDEFLHYPAERLGSLLSKSDLRADSEVDVFHAALRWVRFDIEGRVTMTPLLLRNIRFTQMSPEEILSYVESVEFIMDIPECRIMTLEAYRFFSLSVGEAEQSNIRRSEPRRYGHPPSPRRPAPSHNSPNSSQVLVGKRFSNTHQPPQQGGGAAMLLAIGGLYVDGEDLEKPGRLVQAYDKVKNCWRNLTTMPRPRNHHAAVVLGHYLYVIGGSDPTESGHNAIEPLSTVFQYSFDFNKWDNISPMMFARVYFQAATLNGCVYTVGGLGHDSCLLADVERYDPSKSTWHLVEPLTTPVMAAAVIGYQGLLYVIGGFSGYNSNSATIVNHVYCYSPVTNTWVVKSPMPSPRCHAMAAEINGKLFLAGGAHQREAHYSVSMTSVDIYEVATDSWRHVTNLMFPRHDAGMAALGMKLYIVGGVSSSDDSHLSIVECYDVDKNEWDKSVSSLPLPSIGLVCVSVPAMAPK